MNDIRIIAGDAIQEMKRLGKASVDLIIADPPYNLGKDYGNNHDIKGFDEYILFSRSWLCQVHRLLKTDGTLYILMGFSFN